MSQNNQHNGRIPTDPHTALILALLAAAVISQLTAEQANTLAALAELLPWLLHERPR